MYPLVCYGSVDPNGVIVKEYELEGPKRNMCVCKNVCGGGRPHKISFGAPATFQGVEMWHQSSVIRDIKFDTKTT